MKNQLKSASIAIKHPAGVKVRVPVKYLTKYARSMNRLYRFWWNTKKTVRLLEKVSRLSAIALSDYANITDPYVTLGADFQEASQPEHSESDPPSEALTSCNKDT